MNYVLKGDPVNIFWTLCTLIKFTNLITIIFSGFPSYNCILQNFLFQFSVSEREDR